MVESSYKLMRRNGEDSFQSFTLQGGGTRGVKGVSLSLFLQVFKPRKILKRSLTRKFCYQKFIDDCHPLNGKNDAMALHCEKGFLTKKLFAAWPFTFLIISFNLGVQAHSLN